METLWRQSKYIYLILILNTVVKMLLNQGFLAKVTLIIYSHSTTKQIFRNVDITVFLAIFDYFGDNFGDLFDNDWLPLNCIIVLFACLIEIKPVISSDNSLSTPDHK